ncbi:Snf7-domain-containing protein [Lasiosphaeria miniovina]|uniref:Vacuolar-sorting protein SNF7 n=2 Tax=Lasiosphaeria TaxID=92901 RepID=A0AA40E8Z4_9PEZI|nr:Snf7-domain-containing protein [Lasiosphaeria miniovina]KAK0728406.1 Snf7-domain-containing protein [Lasiosphaeria miniovina]KAK3373569.1 Snf7-domain-containing protein [Lasiosphaeria ovina]
MSAGIWGWFGGGAGQKRKDSPKNAILDLRTQLEMLQKRENHLQRQIEEQDGIARKNVTTNKNAAKAALRRKKLHEHSLDQTLGQIGTLEQQINAIESANINRETLAAMERAGEAMKQIHGKLTPEKVDEAMAKLSEQNGLSEEIAEAMVSINLGNAVDEEDLEADFEVLLQEQLDEKMLKTGTVPQDAVQRLPTVATGEIKGKAPAVAEDDEEEELRKLQAEMAM